MLGDLYNADGSQLTPELIVSPVTGLDVLVPPGVNCQTTLVSLLSSLDLCELQHGSQASYPSHQLIQLDVCRGAYTDIHPCAVHSLLQKRCILPQSKIILPALAQITPFRWTLQRPLEQELPFTYSIKWDLGVQCNVSEGGSKVLHCICQC